MTKEQKFYNVLQDVFIGAKIEGQGGFVNLMRIKSNYYSKIKKILKDDINKALNSYTSFREELFDKLYSFFNRYFTESGSIYFNSTPFHNNIYEKVYTDDKDVILFWKTQMLYYVKTDRIFKSIPVDIPLDPPLTKGENKTMKFYFDSTTIENKKANEKRSLIYELKEVKEDKTIVFNVYYSENGRVTKTEDILKELKKEKITINEDTLVRSFRIFEKQSEVDFFINKNTKAFLKEQFKLWSYQYFWEGAKEWSADRVNQLQILKDIAFKIIDFVSQFEDELVKIWNKPKFVKNSNYVITLDRIKDEVIIDKIINHQNINNQIKEWQELGIVDEKFKVEDIWETDLTGKHLAKKCEHLPIDTKYFKDLELEILSLFDDLDNALDGWLIKSENYQALNTILPKFKEKVQTIYIDPPFNTGNDFAYVDRFQDSTWLSLMHDRIELPRKFLRDDGSFYLHLDQHADYLGRQLMENIFGSENFRNDIIWQYFMGGKGDLEFGRKHDNIIFYSKKFKKNLFNKLKIKRYLDFKPSLDDDSEDGENGKDDIGYYSIITCPDVWSIKGVFNMATEYNKFKTQKPEKLLERILLASSNKNSFILDFFLGSGTTTAVAHKLKRKWIGIEMGDHFYTVVLPRMKKVLAYDKSGISKEVKEYEGGGFFKYYELEQYEETLANTVYENHDMLIVGNKSPYEQYVFMKDEKMLKALEIDYENKKVKVDLSKIYSHIPPVSPLMKDGEIPPLIPPLLRGDIGGIKQNMGGITGGIDIAETLSNLTGKWIKKIKQDEVEFEDGSLVNTKDLDYKLIKPLIWWE